MSFGAVGEELWERGDGRREIERRWNNDDGRGLPKYDVCETELLGPGESGLREAKERGSSSSVVVYDSGGDGFNVFGFAAIGLGCGDNIGSGREKLLCSDDGEARGLV